MSLYALDVTIDGLPPLNPADRKHRWRQIRAKREWTSLVAVYVPYVKRPAAPLEQAQVWLRRYSSVEPDYDNLVVSFKIVVDALVKVGVLANDKPENFTGGHPSYGWEKAPPARGCVRIQVEDAT